MFGLEFIFQGVEPVDHGPGSSWKQGAEAGVWSPVLVSCLQGTPCTSFGSLLRTCLAGVCGGGRYRQRKLLQLFSLFCLLRYTFSRRYQIVPWRVCHSGKKWKVCSFFVCQWLWPQKMQDSCSRPFEEGGQSCEAHWCVAQHLGSWRRVLSFCCEPCFLLWNIQETMCPICCFSSTSTCYPFPDRLRFVLGSQQSCYVLLKPGFYSTGCEDLVASKIWIL